MGIEQTSTAEGRGGPGASRAPGVMRDGVQHRYGPRSVLATRHGGRWLGRIGRIAKARILSGFTRQHLKPFRSFGKRRDLRTLAELLTTGQVAPVVDGTYPLDETADFLRHVSAGHARGKVVISV